MKILKPPRLRKGDLIGVVSPASPPSAQEKIDKGVQYLERLGYRVRVGRHVMAQLGYLAGTDEQRADDLNSMLRDPEVKAVFAVRGGYGTPRLLHRVDYRAIRRHPKIIVGYSDLTALQLAIFRKTSLVTFSGPMVGVEMWEQIDPFTEEHFWRVLTSAARVGVLANPDEQRAIVHNKGAASGRLLGGTFSLLMSLIGTPYFPDLRRSILVLEDVDEAPHRVDRMFAQLNHAGILSKISGLVLGVFTDCVPTDPTKPYLTIDQVLQEAMHSVTCPVLANFQYGHIPRKLTLPIGLRARLDARRGVLEVLESGVSAGRS
ncbi:MAG: LD-carboxypeptidase [Ignavibacteria bacterium]|nr:LD-carboxypeptidase [Ignavibacteria bacterium]